MYDDVIKFKYVTQDLDRTEEFWLLDCYAYRWEAIIDNIVKTTGFYPSKNMQPIREGVFQVKDTTTIEELRGLARHIKEWYKIDCFQISIDREENTAHMLFDFNLREKAKSVVLNRSQQIALSVMILRYLNLPRPKGAEMWLGYFLKDRYTNNPASFRVLQDKLKHAKLGKDSYMLACDVLTYVQQMCQGLVK